MQIVLANWEWFIEPDSMGVWRPPGGGVAQGMDLRSTPQFSTQGGPPGLGVFLFELSRSIPGAVDLGNDLHGPLPLATRREVERVLGGRRIIGNTPQDIVWEMYTNLADITGADGPKPIRATARSPLTLHMGGQVKFEKFDIDGHPHGPKVLAAAQRDYAGLRAEAYLFPANDYRSETHLRYLDALRLKHDIPYTRFIPNHLPDEGTRPRASTTGTETFPTNQAALSTNQDLSWTEVQGNIDVIGNVASGQTSGNMTARCEVALSDDDHDAQCDVDTGVNAAAGPMVRFAASANTGYYFTFGSGTRSDFRINKVSAGSHSILNNLANSDGPDALARYTVNSSDAHEGFWDGTSKITHTDGTITGNVRTGFYIRAQGVNRGKVDNFVASDIAGGPTTIPLTQAILIG